MKKYYTPFHYQFAWVWYVSFFVLPALITCQSKAQSIRNFEPLKAKAPLPERVYQSSAAQFKSDVASLKAQKGEVTDLEKRFLKKQHFAISTQFKRGNLLFNDTLTNYVQRISDRVYEENKSLIRKRPKVYIVNSPIASAYVFHFNEVFVNIGLIAQVQNEAELAYVLAHEFVHYQQKHALKRYKEKRRILKGEKSYEEIETKYEATITKNLFSQVNEREADVQGLKYFNNTNYQKGALYQAFDVLKYAKFPFTEVPFDRSFFEKDFLKFPDKLFLEETAVINPDETIENEKMRTHPNVKKRKRSIEKELGTANLSEGETFLVSEPAFRHVQELARFQICQLYLQKKAYAKAIYCAYALQKAHPDNQYLKSVINTALYNLTMYNNEDELDEVLPDYEEIEGQSQQVYHFLNKLSAEEMNVLATRYAWQLKQAYPDNEIYQTTAKNLLKALVFTHDLSKQNFYEKPRKVLLKAKREELKNKDELSKYDRIEKEQLSTKTNFRKFAFVELLKDTTFNKTFDKLIRKYNANELSTKVEKELEEEQIKVTIQEETESTDESIRSVSVMQPIYHIYKTQYRNERKLIKSEERRRWLTKIQQENGELAGLDMNTLNPSFFDKNDIQRYNRMVTVSQWHNELRRQEEIDGLLNSNQAAINEIIEATGNRYYLWSGIANKKREVNNEFLSFIGWASTIFGAPIGLYKWIKPGYDSYYRTYLLDLKDAEVEIAEDKHFEQGDGKDYIQSFTYNTFHQIANQ